MKTIAFIKIIFLFVTINILLVSCWQYDTVSSKIINKRIKNIKMNTNNSLEDYDIESVDSSNFVAPDIVPISLKSNLIKCNSVEDWMLDTDGIGKYNIEDEAIKYIRTVDKKRNRTSTLRYSFGLTLEELLKWLDQEDIETITTTQALKYYGL